MSTDLDAARTSWDGGGVGHGKLFRTHGKPNADINSSTESSGVLWMWIGGKGTKWSW